MNNIVDQILEAFENKVSKKRAEYKPVNPEDTSSAYWSAQDIKRDEVSVLKRRQSLIECLKIRDKLIELLDLAQELGLQDNVYYPMDEVSAWGKKAPEDKYYASGNDCLKGVERIRRGLELFGLPGGRMGNIEHLSDWEDRPPCPDNLGNYFFIFSDLVFYDPASENLVALHCSKNYIQNQCVVRPPEDLRMIAVEDNSKNLQAIRDFANSIKPVD